VVVTGSERQSARDVLDVLDHRAPDGGTGVGASALPLLQSADLPIETVLTMLINEQGLPLGKAEHRGTGSATPSIQPHDPFTQVHGNPSSGAVAGPYGR
jgi:hypothetical protein